ncbi:MAG: hypothetical protein EOP04_19275 [Proteobacteria bacterium]|nr:MAG: hypothetical protein EOP04_19275 [Pseudomonadota bacterium]
MPGLLPSEIIIVVNDYIGVNAGYLGDFGYRTLEEFYPYYCDIEVDISDYQGTVRLRFIEILRQAEPHVQAKILRGVLQKFPVEQSSIPTRTEHLRIRIQSMIGRLQESAAVGSPSLDVSSAVVERAIADAEILLRDNGATSGVDRVHTTIHGYLKAICTAEGITYAGEPSMPVLLRLIREQHSALANLGPRSDDINMVLNACGTILHSLNPIRNMASVAHPTDHLLEKEEALLVINISRSLLHYLNSKIG